MTQTCTILKLDSPWEDIWQTRKRCLRQNQKQKRNSAKTQSLAAIHAGTLTNLGVSV